MLQSAGPPPPDQNHEAECVPSCLEASLLPVVNGWVDRIGVDLLIVLVGFVMFGEFCMETQLAGLGFSFNRLLSRGTQASFWRGSVAMRDRICCLRVPRRQNVNPPNTNPHLHLTPSTKCARPEARHSATRHHEGHRDYYRRAWAHFHFTFHLSPHTDSFRRASSRTPFGR